MGNLFSQREASASPYLPSEETLQDFGVDSPLGCHIVKLSFQSLLFADRDLGRGLKCRQPCLQQLKSPGKLLDLCQQRIILLLEAALAIAAGFMADR